MTDRPAIRRAVTILAEDNGAALLPFYGAVSGSKEDVIDRMIAGASIGLSETTLDEIETYFAALSDEHLDLLVCGDEDEARDVLGGDPPEAVGRFIVNAAEADCSAEEA